MKRYPEPQRSQDARARRWRLNELSALATSLVLAAVMAIALSGAAVASTPKPPSQSLWQTSLSTNLLESCPLARKALAYYQKSKRTWDRKRGIQVQPAKLGSLSCVQARRLVPVYRKRASDARKQYKKWRASNYVLHERATWLTAVQEAQKAYPGTSAWLKSCSASEGGWGRWVPNSQGSGAGGWMQFMHGTFSGFNRHALSDVRSRGFQHPRSAESWYSPLGQALAGGWAYKRGLTYHWYGGGC